MEAEEEETDEKEQGDSREEGVQTVAEAGINDRRTAASAVVGRSVSLVVAAVVIVGEAVVVEARTLASASAASMFDRK